MTNNKLTAVNEEAWELRFSDASSALALAKEINAQSLDKQDQLNQARGIWNYTWRNFERLERFKAYYDYARKRFNNIAVAVPQAEDASNSDDQRSEQGASSAANSSTTDSAEGSDTN